MSHSFPPSCVHEIELGTAGTIFEKPRPPDIDRTLYSAAEIETCCGCRSAPLTTWIACALAVVSNITVANTRRGLKAVRFFSGSRLKANFMMRGSPL